jgi:hypothetical protein
MYSSSQGRKKGFCGRTLWKKGRMRQSISWLVVQTRFYLFWHQRSVSIAFLGVNEEKGRWQILLDC